MKRSLSLAAYMALASRAPKRRVSFSAARPEGTLIWGHAATGERMRALLQIATRLRGQRPELEFLLTADEGVTPPERLGDRNRFQALPGDSVAQADGFLDHWHPDLCLWAGGHLKPALLYQAAKRDLPMFLIDADEDGLNASHQRWLPELTRTTLRVFKLCLARSGGAAQLMRRLGVPGESIEVTGPLQEGSAALTCRQEDRDELAQVFAGRPVWLAAMVRRDELEIVIEAHRRASRMALRLLLIVVPDDEADGPDFLARLQKARLRVAVWSAGELPDEGCQVLLADTRGEMGLWYRLAPVTLMASSLTPGHGGCDPYEPGALGSAILYGPNVGRHLSSYSRFAAAGAARIVKDSESLVAALQQCMAPDQAALMAAAGWEVASAGAEVTDRVIDLVHDTLDELEAA